LQNGPNIFAPDKSFDSKHRPHEKEHPIDRYYCHVLQELLDKCHPLGMFDAIATLAVASSMRELYRLVLVDTPLAPYFSESLSAG
jgi:hypothetical protein